MARQALGKKKRNKIEAKLGMKVVRAYVDAVWGRHNWAEVYVNDRDSFLVNLKTGDFAQLLMNNKVVTSKPLWRRIGCCA